MKQLTEEQRYNISAYLQSGKSRTEIANLVGVHRSTISRELRRNSDKRNGMCTAVSYYIQLLTFYFICWL